MPSFMRQTAIIKVHLTYVSNSANHTKNSVLPTKTRQFSPNKTRNTFLRTKHRHNLYIPTHSVLPTKQTQKWMSCCHAKFTYVWRNITWTVHRYSQSFVGGTSICIGGKHAAFQVRSEMVSKLYKHWCCCVLWLCLISDDAGRSSSDLAISVITTLRSPWFVETGRTKE